jgi:hypothetical protein
MVLAGTFEESEDWYAELWEEFRTLNDFGGASFSLPMWENLRRFPGGRDDPEIKALMIAYGRVAGMVEERIEGIPVIPTDRYFRDFRRTIHLGHYPFDPSKPVYIAVDPSEGVSPSSVAALQYNVPVDEVERPRRPWDPIPVVRVIDVIYEPLIDEDIIKKAQSKRWWDNVHGGSIDVEEPDSRKRWRTLGGVNLRAQKWSVREGIHRLQSFIKVELDEDGLPLSHLYIDDGVPDDAVSEVARYKQRSEHSQKPHLECADHFLKGLWYELLNRFGPVKRVSKKGIYTPRYRRM